MKKPYYRIFEAFLSPIIGFPWPGCLLSSSLYHANIRRTKPGHYGRNSAPILLPTLLLILQIATRIPKIPSVGVSRCFFFRYNTGDVENQSVLNLGAKVADVSHRAATLEVYRRKYHAELHEFRTEMREGFKELALKQESLASQPEVEIELAFKSLTSELEVKIAEFTSAQEKWLAEFGSEQQKYFT
ncbi:hypothetical protein B0T24DRAFT_161400 [Lasiosphaeria ovina]|uniref:Uncharacterized protein n=1 Tax=Lasiosphaeria ovina TaxID=92902 RepID=A0AAE0ND45_9PEZI|nr:hypothetical protein B0T24DRAFT_161400 [Lasiosphaeria ovina]